MFIQRHLVRTQLGQTRCTVGIEAASTCPLWLQSSIPSFSASPTRSVLCIPSSILRAASRRRLRRRPWAGAALWSWIYCDLKGPVCCTHSHMGAGIEVRARHGSTYPQPAKQQFHAPASVNPVPMGPLALALKARHPPSWSSPVKAQPLANRAERPPLPHHGNLLRRPAIVPPIHA